MPPRILFATDVHGACRHLPGLPAADLLLLGGDLTHFGSAAQAGRILESFRQRFPAVLAVAGNCDAPDADGVLAACGCSLHLAVQEAAGLRICGVGGCNRTPFSTPNEWDEDDMARDLDALDARLAGGGAPLVLVTHAPPFGSGADRLPDGSSVGSRAVAAFVRARRPALVLCGHIHEAAGIFSCEGVPVVNPGPFSQGNYACFDGATLTPARARVA